MEANVTPSKGSATPKAIINLKFRNEAIYITEEVKEESTSNGCPGLAIPQQSPCKYRCRLELRNLVVVSDVFARKRDAEQAAASIALEKFGIQRGKKCLTKEEKMEALVSRISNLFMDEFLNSTHPLIAHFKDRYMREGDLNGLLPISILPACDSKLFNLCKSINIEAETDPLCCLSLVVKAATLSDSVVTSKNKLWISKCTPYSPLTMQSLLVQPSGASVKKVIVKAVYIPFLTDKTVELLTLELSPDEYYMDVLAQKLKVGDSSRVVLSRALGKTSSEMRLYFSIPDALLMGNDASSEYLISTKDNSILKPMFNKRAFYLSEQNVYGDAILAAVGYTRKSAGSLFFEDVTLDTYYRMLLGRLPSGNYKLSTGAILAANLPTAFVTHTNWSGLFPRELLYAFCHQHRLSEPIFSTNSSGFLPTLAVTNKNCNSSESASQTEFVNGGSDHQVCGPAISQHENKFRCCVKILSRDGEHMIECHPLSVYRTRSEAVQNAALKVLTWLDKCLEKLNMPVDMAQFFTEDTHEVRVSLQTFSKEFALWQFFQDFDRKCYPDGILSGLVIGGGKLRRELEVKTISFNVEGPDSGIFASAGCLASICYDVSLVHGDQKHLIEGTKEFEFEIGNSAVMYHIEDCVTQITVGQTARYCCDLNSWDLIFAVAGDILAPILPSIGGAFLEYNIRLSKVVEPFEDRIEQAFFSPPLSKQRLEFALNYIKESQASTLVDFGCGSGSLLDALFEHETTLAEIAGVDISQKSLARAAKDIYLRLSAQKVQQCSKIKAAVLYEGSITEFDPRLHGFDIATCLEVIEHMEEEQAYAFGEIALGVFCPTILIVSTPNYEFNVILQGNSFDGKHSTAFENSEEKSSEQNCRFRNHDHKFEWTRAQFDEWASDLATRHNYDLEISGVGGKGDVEPGFASQIAVFRRRTHEGLQYLRSRDGASNIYQVRWEWNPS